MKLRTCRAVLVLAASMNAACDEDTTSRPDPTIVTIRLAGVSVVAVLGEEPPVPCARAGAEVELAPRVIVEPAGSSYYGTIEIHDASCRADDCVVRRVEENWTVPRIAVSSAIAGRVEVDARIVVGDVSELVRAPVDFSDEPCKAGDR